MKLTKHQILVIASFFAIYFIWGSTYLWNKVAVGQLPPFQLACIRFSTAGLLLLGLSVVFGNSIKITKQQLKNSTIAGFLFLAYGNGAVVWALKFVDSGFAALVISAQPLVVLLLLLVFQGKKIEQSSIIGVILGFVGIFLLVSQSEIIAKENTVLGIVLIFSAMVAWGYGSLFVAKADLPENSFVRTGYQMIIAGAMLLFISLAFGETWVPITAWTKGVKTSMILLVLLGSIVAFTAFNYLLRHVSPEKVATSTYVNPLVALLLGYFYLNEAVSTQSMIAAAILLSGVYFINTKRKKIFVRRYRGGM